MKYPTFVPVTVRNFGILDTILMSLNMFGPIPLYIAITYLGLNLHIPIISDVVETFPRIRMDFNNIEEWYSTERAEEHTRYFKGIISLHISIAVISLIIRIIASLYIGLTAHSELRELYKNSNAIIKFVLLFLAALAVLCLFPSMIDSSPTTRMPEPNTAHAYIFISVYTSLSGFIIYAAPVSILKIINFRSYQKY